MRLLGALIFFTIVAFDCQVFSQHLTIRNAHLSDQQGYWDWQPSTRTTFPYNYNSANNDWIWANTRVENHTNNTVFTDLRIFWTLPDGSQYDYDHGREAVPSGWIWAWHSGYGYSPTWPPGQGSVEFRMRQWVNGQTSGWQTIATRNFTITDKRPDLYELTANRTTAKVGDTINLTARVRHAAKYSLSWSASETTPGWVNPSSSNHSNNYVDGDYSHNNSYIVPESAAGKNLTLTLQASNGSGNSTRHVTIAIAPPEPNFVHNLADKTVSVDIGGSETVSRIWGFTNNGDSGSEVDFLFTKSNGDWLTITPSQGTLINPTSAIRHVDLHVDSHGLEPGTYHSTVTLTSTDPKNSGPFTAVVTFQVGPPPAPDWTITKLNFQEYGPYEPGQTVPVELEVSNIGTAPAPASRLIFMSNDSNTEVDHFESIYDIPEIGAGESHTMTVFAWCGPNTDILYIAAEANIDDLHELNFDNNRTFSFMVTQSTTVMRNRLFGNSEIKTGFSGDPVNTATGNFVHHSTDLDIPSRISDFRFTRFYNSLSSEISSLGRGWRHSFMYSMDLADESRPGVVFPDGRSEYWNEVEGVYIPLFRQIFNSLEKVGTNWQLTKKDLSVYFFDSTGRCTGYTDKNGNSVTFGYTGANLTSVTDPAGRVLNLQYSGSRLVQVQDWTGRKVEFAYTGDNLTKVTDVRGNDVTFGYDVGHRLNRITDQRGIDVVTLVYDNLGRAVSQDDGRGNTMTFEYNTPVPFSTTITTADGESTVHVHNSAFQLVQVVDELGREVSFTYDPITGLRNTIEDKAGNPATNFVYDARGNLLETTFPDGSTETYTYNAQDLPTQRIDQQGYITTWTYDANGNVLMETDALGNTTTWTYNSFGQKLTETDRNGSVKTFTYDSLGRLTRIEDADGVGTTFAYDALWRKVSETDDRGNTVTTVFNADDSVAQIQRPIGTTAFTYDQAGNKLTETDALGNTTEYEYDGNHNKIKVTLPDGLGITSFEYDLVNRLVSTTDGRGNVWSKLYYADGRLHKEIDPLGNENVYTYDPNGNILTETDGSGRIVTHTYDVMNRRLTTTDGEGNTTTFGYDHRGLRTSIINPMGNETIYEHDRLQRLSSVRVKGETAGSDALTTYNYDGEDRLLTVTDAEGSEWSNEYSSAGRRIKRIDGLLRETHYTYDNAGNLLQITYPTGETETYTYDQNNRRTGLAYSDGRSATFTLDANGNTLQQVDWAGDTTYTYDALNRITSVTDPFGKTVGYTYDLAGNRTAITYPSVGQVTYVYDERDGLTGVSDWNGNSFSYVLDQDGRVSTRTFPNGVMAQYSYDAAGRLTSLIYTKDGDTIISYNLTFDANGNPINVINTGLPAIDALYSKNLTYTYDEAHQLLTDSENEYQYDERGALIHREQPAGLETALRFTADGMLASYSSLDGTFVENLFDSGRMRIRSTRNGNETRYVMDRQRGMANVIAEAKNTGQLSRWFVHGDQTLAMYNEVGTPSHFYITDPFGNVVALTDPTGAVTDTYRFDPFGNVIGRSGTTDNPFTFVGAFGAMSEPSGLYFMRARFYEPEMGRFISVDPMEGDIVNPSTLHRYLYSHNNSLLFIDPDGEFAFGLKSLGAAVIGGSANMISYAVKHNRWQNPHISYGDYWAGAGKAFGKGFVVSGTAALAVETGGILGVKSVKGVAAISGATGFSIDSIDQLASGDNYSLLQAIGSGAVSAAGSGLLTHVGHKLDDTLLNSLVASFVGQAASTAGNDLGDLFRNLGYGGTAIAELEYWNQQSAGSRSRPITDRISPSDSPAQNVILQPYINIRNLEMKSKN